MCFLRYFLVRANYLPFSAASASQGGFRRPLHATAVVVAVRPQTGSASIIVFADVFFFQLVRASISTCASPAPRTCSCCEASEEPGRRVVLIPSPPRPSFLSSTLELFEDHGVTSLGYISDTLDKYGRCVDLCFVSRRRAPADQFPSQSRPCRGCHSHSHRGDRVWISQFARDYL